MDRQQKEMVSRQEPGNLSEAIAYWFFRLNGCFTIENLVLHPNRRGPQKTEADIVAVRFKHRRELAGSEKPMDDDHEIFQKSESYVSAFFVGVRSHKCRSNLAWIDRKKRNIQRALDVLGFVAEQDIDCVAEHLYEQSRYVDRSVDIRIVEIGSNTQAGKNNHKFQLTFDELLEWIFDRFRTYANQKADNKQWDSFGKELYQTARRMSKTDFVVCWKEKAGIRQCNKDARDS